jgi:hypothetical protein
VLPPLSAGDLTLYELQQPFVEPLLRMFRFTNTALDVLFYDVEVLRSSILAKDTRIGTIRPPGYARPRILLKPST